MEFAEVSAVITGDSAETAVVVCDKEAVVDAVYSADAVSVGLEDCDVWLDASGVEAGVSETWLGVSLGLETSDVWLGVGCSASDV